MTIMPIKYEPADKFEGRWFDGMVLIIGLSLGGILLGTALGYFGMAGWLLFYAVLSTDLLLIGWCIANALASIELQKESKQPTEAELKKYMEGKGFHYGEGKQ